ncbi:MAG: hypothetical protein ACK4RV_02250 [Caulobacter sp.]
MAVANTKSTVVTGADSTPRVLSNPHLARGTLIETVGVCEVAAADDNASVYRFVRVRSSDRISEIMLANDAITGGTDYDVGIYETAAYGGAVVSKDVFADGLDVSSAVAFRDVLYHDAAANIDKAEKRVWEWLGLSADPQKDYDIAATGNTVGSGAGTLALRVRLCAGN